MLLISARFSPSVPFPEIPLTLTVYTEGLTAVTCVNVEPIVPVFAKEKSVGSTPVTASLKVTVKLTVFAFVVALAEAARLID